MRKLVLLTLLVMGCSSSTSREPEELQVEAAGGSLPEPPAATGGVVEVAGGAGGEDVTKPAGSGGMGGSEVIVCSVLPSAAPSCDDPNCPTGQVCVLGEAGSEHGSCEAVVEIGAGVSCSGPPEVCEAGYYCFMGTVGYCMQRIGTEVCSVTQPCDQGAFCNENSRCQSCMDY